MYHSDKYPISFQLGSPIIVPCHVLEIQESLALSWKLQYKSCRLNLDCCGSFLHCILGGRYSGNGTQDPLV